MIEFSDNKPIYRQIVDYSYNLILGGEWEPGARVPSVRELSARLGVNTRTVLKAMEHLQGAGIIQPKRGMGFILDGEARQRVEAERRKEFFEGTLPFLISEMKILGITPEELAAEIRKRFSF